MDIFHGFIALFGWILFVYWWNRVIPQVGARDAAVALAFIALTVLATVIATLAWVLYNIGIFRRKGPRRNLPAVSENYDADFLGRKIDRPGLDSIRGARIVTVSLRGDVKKIEISDGA